MILPTVCLTRESTETNPPPLLLRNFSVSSTFDEEYRLPLSNDEDQLINQTESNSPRGKDMISPSNCASISSLAHSSKPVTVTDSMEEGAPRSHPFQTKPQPPLREESESWVKLSALDQDMNDMDNFDIDTVFGFDGN